MSIENTGFLQGLNRGVWEIKGFRFRKCPRDFLEFFYAPRGRDSSFFGLFSTLRVVWLCFMP